MPIELIPFHCNRGGVRVKGYTFVAGQKIYELSNHLGNVLSTISDRKIQASGTGGVVDYYLPDVRTMTDYYPFGMAMDGRTETQAGTEAYRFGFNGQMKDDEVYGEGNRYTAEFWQYDPRTARRWNVDPVDQISISNYAAFLNSPIIYNDPKGDCPPCAALAAATAAEEAMVLLGLITTGFVAKQVYDNSEHMAPITVSALKHNPGYDWQKRQERLAKAKLVAAQIALQKLKEYHFPEDPDNDDNFFKKMSDKHGNKGKIAAVVAAGVLLYDTMKDYYQDRNIEIDKEVKKNEQELDQIRSKAESTPEDAKRRFYLQNQNDLLLQEKQANIDASEWAETQKMGLEREGEKLSNTGYKTEPRDNTQIAR